MPRISPNLWFSTQAEEAVQHYVDAFGDGAIRGVLRYGPEAPALEGSVMTVHFELFGQPFVAINGGPEFEGNPEFTFNEAISLEVSCATQDEIDRCWNALVAGGKPGPCGWLTDRYGVAWQVTPHRLLELLTGEDPGGVRRVTQAMLATSGVPFSIAALQAAYDGVDS